MTFLVNFYRLKPDATDYIFAADCVCFFRFCLVSCESWHVAKNCKKTLYVGQGHSRS